MELRVQIPFKQILTAIKTLTLAQKAKIREELDGSKVKLMQSSTNFTEKLLQGPVFTSDEIKVIKKNRKSIAQWRTKE